MGQNIKYGDLKNLSDDVEIIQIIDMVYDLASEQVDDDTAVSRCDLKFYLNALVKKKQISGEQRMKFGVWWRGVSSDKQRVREAVITE